MVLEDDEYNNKLRSWPHHLSFSSHFPMLLGYDLPELRPRISSSLPRGHLWSRSPTTTVYVFIFTHVRHLHPAHLYFLYFQ